jgi:signal transduction histidine kinase
MIKLFLKFYFVIAIPLLFLFIPTINPAYRLLGIWAEEHYTQYFEGLFSLLNLELENLAVEDQQKHIVVLNHHFGNQIGLIPLAELELSAEKVKRLQNNETVFKRGRVARLYQKAPGTDNIIVINLDQSDEDAAYDTVRGPIYLLNKVLKDSPVADWPKIIRGLTREQNFTVQLKRKSQVPPAVSNNPRLLENKSVRFDHEKHLMSIYAPTPDRDWLYQFGPVDERNFYNRIETMNRVLPASLLALGILFLAWPLYRDIKKLRTAARSLGHGHLETRVRLGKSAALNPLATAFNTMAARIQKLIFSHRDLTNAVSHELKTPLTRLRFSHEILRDNPSADVRLRHLNNIERDIGELETMIAELLEHARYERPAGVHTFERIDLGEWINGIILPFQESFPKVEILLNCNPQEPCMIRMEKRALARAVENLLTNALCHCHDTINVNFDCRAEEIILTVEDDGRGIAENDRQRIFEPFVRLDSSRHRKTGGSGLGLAITRKVAEMHNGSISCDASELGGARFTMRLGRFKQ